MSESKAKNSIAQATNSDQGDISDRPRPEWIRGICPECGEPLVSNAFYIASENKYIHVWDCWGALGAIPTCNYRQVFDTPPPKAVAN